MIMDFAFLRRLAVMAVILAIQVLLLNNIHLFDCITPLLIGYMIIYTRRGASRIGVMLVGFFVGLLFDMFSNTLGMGAASCTLLAFVQPSLLGIFTPRDAADDFEPGMHAMGIWLYAAYLFSSMLVLHAAFYILEAFSVSDWRMALMAIFGGTVLSTAIVFICESITSNQRGILNR